MNRRPRTRPRRWLRRSVIGLVALAALAWIVYRLAAPPLVRHQVTLALRELGMESPRFELEQAGLWRTELRNISGQGKYLTVSSASIAYGIGDVLAGRVDTITLRGIEMNASLRDGELDLGPFSTRQTESGGGELPFNKLLIDTSMLHLDWEGQDWWLPLSATLTNQGDGRLHLSAVTFAGGSPVTIEATQDRVADDLQIDVTAPHLNIATILAAVPPSLLGRSVRAGGHAGVGFTYRSRAGEGSTQLALDPSGLWADLSLGDQRLALQNITGHVETTLNHAWRPVKLTAAGSVESVELGGAAMARDVQIDLDSAEEKLTFSLTGSGDQWRLVKLEGDVPGILPYAVAPATAPSPQPPAAMTAQIVYELTGRLPGWVVEELVGRGVDASALGEGTLEGEGELFFNPRAIEGRPRWGLETTLTRLALPPGDLLIEAGDARLQGLEGLLSFSGSVGPREATVRLLDEGWISAQSIASGSGERATHAADVQLALLPADSGPAVRVLFGDDNTRVTASVLVQSAAPLKIDAAGTSIDAGGLEIEAAADAGAGKAASIGATVQLDDAAVRFGESKTALEGISAQIPLTWNRPAERGKFSIAGVVLDGKQVGPLAGDIGIAEGEAIFTAHWSPLKGADVSVSGLLSPGDAGWNGQIDAELKPFTLTDGSALADLASALEGMGITGRFGGKASVKLEGSQIEPRVELSLENATLIDAEHGLAAEGVSGELVLNSVSPLSTAGRQRLTIDRLSKGDLVLTEGVVDFQVETAGSILVEQTEWNWAGGRLYSHAFRVRPPEPNVDIVLFADGIRVKELLELTAKDRATGEGTLYGRLPLSIHWPKIEFGNGFLYSRPGTFGQLSFNDADTVAAMLERADPRFKRDPNFAQVRQRVIDALRDFEYDQLRVDLENEPDGGLLARISLHGKGRIGKKPQELYLTGNIRGFEDVLNTYLRVQERLSGN